MKSSFETLLFLLRSASGNVKCPDSLMPVSDWREVMNLAQEHGVAAIALDGYQKVWEYEDIPEDIRYEWLGRSVSIENNYQSCCDAIKSLAGFYDKHGISMMLLKGTALSLNYPIPSHRSPGDIDVYNFGHWKLADQCVEQELGIKVDTSHHHHTVFNYKGFVVENHFDFVNVKAHKNAYSIETKLKDLAGKSIENQIDGIKIYTPSADFNAIFLIRHAAQHFAGSRLTLRQLLDWGYFIDKHSSEVDWSMAVPFIKNMGCWRFFCAVNGICTGALGFDASLFPGFDRDLDLEKRILDDTLQPEFKATGNGAIFKFRRWCANIWKHKIVYDEKLVPLFCTLAWSHIKKPAFK